MTSPQIFVGRQAELERMHQYAEEAFAGQAIILGLKGELGTGKSTLAKQFVSELSERRGHIQVLTGHCIDADAMPYLPYVEALRRYFKITGVDQPRSIERTKEVLLGISKDIVGLAPVVGPLLTIGVSIAENVSKNLLGSQVELEQGKLFHAVAQLLAAMASKCDAVLLLEDMHLADRSSIHLLQYLATELLDKSVLILITFRDLPNEQGVSAFRKVWGNLLQHDLAKEIALSDFTVNEFDAFLAKILQGDSIGEDVRKILLAQTHANPFFLTQIITSLLSEKILTKIDNVWQKRNFEEQLKLPASVESAVQEVLRSLTPEIQETLEVAAVIGDRFEYPVLASATDLTETILDNQIDALTKRRVLTEIPEVFDVYGFVNAVIRDIVYRQIASRRRRRVHTKVAQSIELLYQRNIWDVVESLAHHYHEAGILEKAVEYDIKSAQKARGLLAYHEALHYYERVIGTLSNDDPRLSNVLIAAGEVADQSSEWEQARKYYESLLRIATSKNDSVLMAAAYRGLASVNFREGRWHDSELASHQHMNIADTTNDVGEKAYALFNLGQVYWRTGKWQKAKEHLAAALNIQDNLGLYDSVLATLAILGVIERNEGNFDRALKIYDQAIELYNKHQVADRYWLGVIYNNKGTALRSIAAQQDLKSPGNESSYWQLAIDAYNNSLEITTKIGSSRDIGNTCNNLAIIFSSKRHPDLEKALEYCQRAEQHLRRINAPVDLLDTLRVMGVIQFQTDHFEDSQKHLNESLNLATQIGALDKIGLAHLELGNLYKRQGLYSRSRSEYSKARDQFMELGAATRIELLDNLLHQLEDL